MNKNTAYKETLAEFRKRNFKEMEINLKIAKEVRDDQDAKHKDRIDAIKTISRMLGTLAPEKIEKKETPQKEAVSFTKAEQESIEKRLKATLGDLWTQLSENT